MTSDKRAGREKMRMKWIREIRKKSTSFLVVELTMRTDVSFDSKGDENALRFAGEMLITTPLPASIKFSGQCLGFAVPEPLRGSFGATPEQLQLEKYL